MEEMRNEDGEKRPGAEKTAKNDTDMDFDGCDRQDDSYFFCQVL
jgi:hypothetical protein